MICICLGLRWARGGASHVAHGSSSSHTLLLSTVYPAAMWQRLQEVRLRNSKLGGPPDKCQHCLAGLAPRIFLAECKLRHCSRDCGYFGAPFTSNTRMRSSVRADDEEFRVLQTCFAKSFVGRISIEVPRLCQHKNEKAAQ